MADYRVIVFSGCYTLDGGGVSTHLRMLLGELDRNAMDFVRVLGRSRMDAVVDRLLSYRGRRYGNDTRESANLMWHIGSLARKLRRVVGAPTHKPTVIHCHDRACVMAAMMVCGDLPWPIVQTAHAPFWQQYQMEGAGMLTQLVARAMDPQVVRGCDHVIAVDDLQRDLILEQDPAASVTVIPNAVDVDLLDRVASEPSVNRFGTPYIIVARHFHHKCGVHVAIEAFARSRCRDSHLLVLLGRGHERQRLMELTQKLNLSSRVIFLGARPYSEALRLIRNARISVIPSIPVGQYIEATSLTMLETLGFGVPLIASSIGGLKQVLEGTGAGVLVEPNDPDALAGALDQLIDDAETRSVLAKRGRALVREHYATGPWFRRIAAVYEGALLTRGGNAVQR